MKERLGIQNKTVGVHPYVSQVAGNKKGKMAID